jgi:hypothetical protein
MQATLGEKGWKRILMEAEEESRGAREADLSDNKKNHDTRWKMKKNNNMEK